MYHTTIYYIVISHTAMYHIIYFFFVVLSLTSFQLRNVRCVTTQAHPLIPIMSESGPSLRCSSTWNLKVSISTTFYVQLLQAQIPKVQKDTDGLTVFSRFWDMSSLKLQVNMLVKSTQGFVIIKSFNGIASTYCGQHVGYFN